LINQIKNLNLGKQNLLPHLLLPTPSCFRSLPLSHAAVLPTVPPPAAAASSCTSSSCCAQQQRQQLQLLPSSCSCCPAAAAGCAQLLAAPSCCQQRRQQQLLCQQLLAAPSCCAGGLPAAPAARLLARCRLRDPDGGRNWRKEREISENLGEGLNLVGSRRRSPPGEVVGRKKKLGEEERYPGMTIGPWFYSLNV